LQGAVLFAYTDHIRATQAVLQDDTLTGPVAPKMTSPDGCVTSDSDSTDGGGGGYETERTSAERSGAKGNVTHLATVADDKLLPVLVEGPNTKAKPALHRALSKRVSSQLLRARRLSLYFPGIALLYQVSTLKRQLLCTACCH
jgi:hypothetical protein